MVGAHQSPYLNTKEWEASFGFRWQYSDRHFTGVKEDEERQEEGSEVINDIYLFDVGVTYAFTQRIHASLSVPFQYANRSSALRQAGEVVDRSSVQNSSIGDISVRGRCWLFNPAANPTGNIALGVGVKFPTADYKSADHKRKLTGTTLDVNDQSIQPGDGGYGFILDMQAFKQLFEGNLTLYTSATYLFNPEGTNDARTGRRRASEAIMSVPDQYLARAGVAVPIPWIDSCSPWEDGLSLTLGARIEGVPVDDAIGKSDGFRRPGYAVSIEPGLVYAFGKNIFNLSAPVAVQRNRQRSNTDEIDNTHGDAAFADFIILFGYSRRF